MPARRKSARTNNIVETGGQVPATTEVKPQGKTRSKAGKSKAAQAPVESDGELRLEGLDGKKGKGKRAGKTASGAGNRNGAGKLKIELVNVAETLETPSSPLTPIANQKKKPTAKAKGKGKS